MIPNVKKTKTTRTLAKINHNNTRTKLIQPSEENIQNKTRQNHKTHNKQINTTTLNTKEHVTKKYKHKTKNQKPLVKHS